ncbi:MAG: hypothetical protein K2N12_07380 [Helicobacter sp.]|nr:hypothetical protein [Helicobacter sp.]
MRKFLVLALCVGFLAIGCEDKSQKKTGFVTNLNDCGAAFNSCMSECGSGRNCVNKCEQARGMCNSLRIRGCMQKCNEQFGKGTSSAESCKKNCQQMRSQ